MKFNPGDICVYDPAISLSCLVIMEVERETPEPVYSCLDLKNRNYYSMKEKRLTKIGNVLPELGPKGVEALLSANPALPSEDDLEFIHGRARAKKEVALGSPLDRERWQLLARAKPGDVFKIRGRHETEEVTFHYVLERGEQYVFLAANSNGKLLRYRLTTLIVSGASPLR